MANLKKNELEFLIQLKNELEASENHNEKVLQLQEIINRHLAETEKINKKTWDAIKERRKIDKNYARTPYIKVKDRKK